jgi:hypothetical protein
LIAELKKTLSEEKAARSAVDQALAEDKADSNLPNSPFRVPMKLILFWLKSWTPLGLPSPPLLTNCPPNLLL